MTLGQVVQLGCEVYIVVTVGGSVFYFAKGALRGSSQGCRLAGGVQAVIANGRRVHRSTAWFGVMMAIKDDIEDARQIQDPLNFAAAWGGAKALFSAHRGVRAAIHEGIKGAAYSMVTGLAAAGAVFVFLQSRKSSAYS